MNFVARPLRKAKSELGQAAIEFAGAMIPFTLVFLLIVDGGIYFINYVDNTNRVREGARCGAIGGTDAAIRGKVQTPQGSTGPANVQRVDGPDAGNTVGAGDEVRVETTWVYDWITPVQFLGLSETTTRTARSVMRLETDTFTKPC